jgi:hypothetical protein
MKRIAIALGAMMTLGAEGAEAVPYQWGSFSLKPGETRRISLLIGREVKVCNDFFSGGTMTVAIGAHDPHRLMPGVCTDDVGGDIVATNHGSGPAFGTWAPSYGHQTSSIDPGSVTDEAGNQEHAPRKVLPRAS